jgi:uncharacterized 2Fe-2S/4Fe-4S cluster protein (DUF4445 family)
LPGAQSVQVAVTTTPRHLQIQFANLKREAESLPDETIFQSARRSAIRLVGACGGRGVCGTCVVRVLSGDVEVCEGAGGRDAHVSGHWLRSCRVQPLTDCVVEVGPRSLAPIARAEVDGESTIVVRPRPAVEAYEVTLSRPSLGDNLADADRVLAAVARPGVTKVDIVALRGLPGLLRGNAWRVQAMVRGDEVIAFRPVGHRALGLAVDLGTTNCAGFLMDLASGKRLATLGIENPQTGYGADLVSRINHAIRSEAGAAELSRGAITAIGELARDLCEAVDAETEDIVDVAVCGNTAMHHLLLGLPVRQLGRAPFVPAVLREMDIKARDLGLPVAAGASVYFLPNVGGYVGGDHVAALLATEAHWQHGTTVVMDIGTNTEISLIHDGAITTLSTPSGPAIEGAHISSGMRAAEGAIERVRVANGGFQIDVIGEAEAVGVCGSGALDAVAALRQLGVIDNRGMMLPGQPLVTGAGKHRQVLLAPEVTITQGDVRAIQLAKAATRTGIDLLLEKAGIQATEVEQFVIAGAFGSYINIESAVRIGLLPDVPLDRFTQVGNAAGVGVRMVLTSTEQRARAREIAARCDYVELGFMDTFRKTFIGRIGF